MFLIYLLFIEKSLPDNKNLKDVKELDSEEILVKIGKIVQKNGYVCLPAFEQKVRIHHT